jgi:AcrR family transcriptional regulator
VVQSFSVAGGGTDGERQRLLSAAIDHVAHNGLTDLSLRRLAAELGTSHRMLSHYFGSKDGLWVAIVHEVERRQIAVMDELTSDPSTPFEDEMRTWWRHISDPSLWPNERLFFEIYGQALHGRPPTSDLLDGIVESWLEPASARIEARGVHPEDARAFARLGLAVVRGLLLDLLATGDREGVDEAMERWIALNRRFTRAPGTAPARPAGSGGPAD